jgi:hypothetical protein
MTTSWVGVTSSDPQDALVAQHAPVMTDDPAADSSVVIFVLDALTSAVIDGFAGDHDLVVVIFIAMSPDHTAAGCLLADEATVVVHAAPPSVAKMTLGNAAKHRPRVRSSGIVGFGSRGVSR